MQDLSFIAWCLEHLNYGTIFLLMTIESSFIPFPSEVVVPPAGYLARAGELSSWGVVLASSLGAIAGALINYLLALWLGRPLVYRFVNSRLGHAGKRLVVIDDSIVRGNTQRALVRMLREAGAKEVHVRISLGFISQDGMMAATEQPAENMCTACFTGEYTLRDMDK